MSKRRTVLPRIIDGVEEAKHKPAITK